MIFNNIFKVCLGTFVEFFKTKIIYISIIMSCLLIFTSKVAMELVYGVQSKLLVDFSLGVQSIFVTVLSIFMGANLITEDLKTKYVYMLLSRPVKRFQYLIGKVLGLIFVILFLNTILSMTSLMMFHLYGGNISVLLINAQMLLFFNSFILVLISVFFSFVFDQYLSIFMTLIILILGYSLPILLANSDVMLPEKILLFLRYFSRILPDFNIINLNSYVGYNIVIELKQYINIYSYVLILVVILMILNTLFFSKKEL